VHHVAGHAAPAKACECQADAIAVRLVVVIADPGLEQVAEYVERCGAGGARGQELDELLPGRRLGGIQVQIGDEQRAQGGSLGAGS